MSRRRRDWQPKKVKCPNCSQTVLRLPETDLIHKRTGRLWTDKLWEEHPPVNVEFGSTVCYRLHRCIKY